MDLYNRYVDVVYATNSKLIESHPQYAALGKAAQQAVLAQQGSWLKALAKGRKAFDDLATGLRETDAQIQFADAVREVYGDWTKLSPGERTAVTTYAPFYMWARASSRFVLLALPAKHPIKTGLLALASEMTEQERTAFGLNLFAKRRLPGFLQGSIPTPSGGALAAEYYTSFGVFNDYPENMASFILPQFNSTFEAMRGRRFTGETLTNPDGSQMHTAQKSQIAGYTMLEGFIPFLAIGRRLQEGGGVSAPDSTILNPQVKQYLKRGKVRTTKKGDALDALKKIAVPRAYDRGTVDYLRDKSRTRQIDIPINPKKKGGFRSSGGGGAGPLG